MSVYNFVHMKRSNPGRPRRERELVVFQAQMTPAAKRRLKALAEVEGTHAYTLLEEAFELWWGSLPKAKRDAAELIASAIERARREGGAS
jgi:hypothetical protein